MLRAYLTYPDGGVVAHRTSSCDSARGANAWDTRHVVVNRTTASATLKRFVDEEYIFASRRHAHDMWLEIDFEDATFEAAVLEFVQRLLARGHDRFRRGAVDWHC